MVHVGVSHPPDGAALFLQGKDLPVSAADGGVDADLQRTVGAAEKGQRLVGPVPVQVGQLDALAIAAPGGLGVFAA